MTIPSELRGPAAAAPATGVHRLLADRPELRAVLELIADEVLILHGPVDASGERRNGRSLDGAVPSGADIDCAVSGLDHTWPLRLGAGWRICQCFHYDLRAWFWVLERDGRVVCVDTIEDPDGLGRDAFPTRGLTRPGVSTADSSTVAAYLTAKRLRKAVHEHSEWDLIGQQARNDGDRYRALLRRAMGSRLERLVGEQALEGRPPSRETMRSARAALFIRRFRSPSRLARGMVLGGRRELGRAARPTGLMVLVAGPDGSGKSTLAASVADGWDGWNGVFRRRTRSHWRPGVLPRPGALIGRAAPDPSRPHGRPAHPRGLSAVLALYFWADFVVGHWAKVVPTRSRSGLVIVERGWWDLLVDPARYRLDPPKWLIRLLGRAVPRPDLAFVLESDPGVLRARKAELGADELARQAEAWRTALPKSVPAEFLDASRSRDELEGQVREHILRFLEQRTVARLGGGWAALPTRTAPRWLLPRRPRRAAMKGLDLFQPMNVPGRTGRRAARVAAWLGGFGAMPLATGPPATVRERLAPHLARRTRVAFARTNHPGRVVALFAPEDGSSTTLAKVAEGPEGEAALAREAEALRRLGPLLDSPLAPPVLLAEEPGLLIFEAERWRVRPRPWMLEEEVAAALGRFFAAGSKDGGSSGPLHGDFAPWNLLHSDRGWVVIDWEYASEDGPPFYDLFHYLVQGLLHLGRPSIETLLAGLREGTGWVGAALGAYASEAGLGMEDPLATLARYLRASARSLEGRSSPPEDDVAGRLRLLQEIDG